MLFRRNNKIVKHRYPSGFHAEEGPVSLIMSMSTWCRVILSTSINWFCLGNWDLICDHCTWSKVIIDVYKEEMCLKQNHFNFMGRTVYTVNFNSFNQLFLNLLNNLKILVMSDCTALKYEFKWIQSTGTIFDSLPAPYWVLSFLSITSIFCGVTLQEACKDAADVLMSNLQLILFHFKSLCFWGKAETANLRRRQ